MPNRHLIGKVFKALSLSSEFKTVQVSRNLDLVFFFLFPWQRADMFRLA
jgi:hypothetical protein